MSEYIKNLTGHFYLPNVETTTIVPVVHESGFLDQLTAILNQEGPILEYTTHPEDSGVYVFYAKASVETEGHLFKTFTVEAKIAVLEIATASNTIFIIFSSELKTMIPYQKARTKVEEVKFEVLAAKAGAQFGSYIGVDASVNLVVGTVSIFDAKLGFGVSSGFGIRDEAVEVKALGCGFTVGKRIGISIFDNSFEINFGRLF